MKRQHGPWIAAASLSALVAFATPASAQRGRWPLDGPVRTPSKAQQIPTMLRPVAQSLTAMLDDGGRIVNASIGRDGPVVTILYRTKAVLCVVAAQDPTTDQNVATSECYALN